MRETETLDYPGAVEWLADRYGVRLEYEESSPGRGPAAPERDRLLRLLDDAAEFYARFLWEAAEAAPARAYLAERGIADETAERFRLGLCAVRARPGGAGRAGQGLHAGGAGRGPG